MDKTTFIKKVHNVLASTLFVCINAAVSVGMTYTAYYERRVERATFKSVYGISLIMLLASFVIFLFTYLNKDEKVNKLLKESLSGYFFFIAFILITLVLRG